MGDIFYFIGIIGLILIIIGVFIKEKNRKIRDILFFIGGVLLTAYSFSIKDIIFIILEITFTIVSAYDLVKHSGNKKR